MIDLAELSVYTNNEKVTEHPTQEQILSAFELMEERSGREGRRCTQMILTVRDSQQNKCSSPRSLPLRLCGSDFSRQPKWNSLILESPLGNTQ